MEIMLFGDPEVCPRIYFEQTAGSAQRCLLKVRLNDRGWSDTGLEQDSFA